MRLDDFTSFAADNIGLHDKKKKGIVMLQKNLQLSYFRIS